jgi:predicted ferric reductase
MTATAAGLRPTRLEGPRVGAARLDAWVRSVSAAALWAILLLVTYWWAANGGIQDLTGWESALMSTGRLTGLIASALLLVQVLLMARIPTLEKAYGQDRLARLHRWVGFTSFNLMIAHIGLITWGYAAGRLSATPRTIWDLTWDYPGMLLALAGTLCLVMVVVTSIKAARSRLRYESWHLLHLYAYLGAGLALPHQLWTGQEFLNSTATTVFWWSLWGAAVGAVLIWRVALPLHRSARHQLRVTSVHPEGDGSVSVYLTGRRLGDLQVQSGQFFTWRFLGRRGWTRANPYSLSAAPDGTSLRITVKDLGDGSGALRLLRPGTRVLIEGPYGRLSPRARTRRSVVLIGAGVGITPLRALAEGLDYDPGEATLIYRYATEPLFLRELDVLRAERGLQVQLLPGRRRAANSWASEGFGSISDLAALRPVLLNCANPTCSCVGPSRGPTSYVEQPWPAAYPLTGFTSRALDGDWNDPNCHVADEHDHRVGAPVRLQHVHQRTRDSHRRPRVDPDLRQHHGERLDRHRFGCGSVEFFRHHEHQGVHRAGRQRRHRMGSGPGPDHGLRRRDHRSQDARLSL